MERQSRHTMALRVAVGLASVAILHCGATPSARAEEPAPKRKVTQEGRKPEASWTPNPYGAQFQYLGRTGMAEEPAMLLTQSLATGAEAELREDLMVMDRLVRGAVQRSAPSGDGPTAMGIKLTAINRGLPLYLEGAGAVFSATVNWPLAAAAGDRAGEGDGKEKPKVPDSAWERAKREVTGAADGGDGPRYVKSDARPPFEFEQGRLDELIDAIVKALPEASNVRHFDADEHVFVTVSGLDEANAPARLTMKAKKSDIDAVAKGSISPSDFRKKVGVRVSVGDVPKGGGDEYFLQRQ